MDNGPDNGHKPPNNGHKPPAVREDASVTPGETETADLAEAAHREPLALETALTWLAKVKPAAVLTLLRDPDFALVSMTAFGGFRVNATGYANPLVRRRLAQEAVRDEKFADKLQALAEQVSASLSGFAAGSPEDGEKDRARNAAAALQSLSKDNHETQPDSAKPSSHSDGSPPGAPVLKVPGGQIGGSEARLAALKTERDQRRRERDDARQALAESEAARQEHERRRQQAEAERDDALQQSQRQAQRVERLERQVKKLKSEQADLVRALHQREAPSVIARPTPKSSKTLSAGGRTGSVDTGNPWQAAVTHLLNKGRYDMALTLAEDVLRSAPDDPEALDIAARAQGAKGDMREAAALLRRRLAVTLSQNARTEAGEVLLRLLLLAPSDSDRDLRAFLSGLRPDDAPAVAQARTLLTRLRGAAPETHTAVAAAITRLAPPTLVEALMPPPGRVGPDDPLPLGLPGHVSARQLLRAVDMGHVDLVEGARAALGRLAHTDPTAWDQVRQALERAAGSDASALVALLSTSGRGPAVVDGSNAAWFDQESLAAGRPRLRPLLGLRRALHARGYFPVLLFADAPLPYTIDEPEALRAMVAQGELTLVDSGVDADEVLLREAKHFRAPLITNDYMTDWDPNNEVPKIRFTLSFNGEAYLSEA